jgi:hypothetical protein
MPQATVAAQRSASADRRSQAGVRGARRETGR